MVAAAAAAEADARAASLDLSASACFQRKFKGRSEVYSAWPNAGVTRKAKTRVIQRAGTRASCCRVVSTRPRASASAAREAATAARASSASSLARSAARLSASLSNRSLLCGSIDAHSTQNHWWAV